jgi:WD40 repeat protein
MTSLAVKIEEQNEDGNSNGEYISPMSRGTATSVESFFDDELTSGDDEDSEDEFFDARGLSEEINKDSSLNDGIKNSHTKKTRRRLSSFDDEPTLFANSNNNNNSKYNDRDDDNGDNTDNTPRRRPTTPAELFDAISEHENSDSGGDEGDGEEEEEDVLADLPEGHFYLTKIGDDGKKYTVVARSNAFGEIIPIHTSPHSPRNKQLPANNISSGITKSNASKNQQQPMNQSPQNCNLEHGDNNSDKDTPLPNSSSPSLTPTESKKNSKRPPGKHNRASTATAVLGDVDELMRNVKANENSKNDDKESAGNNNIGGNKHNDGNISPSEKTLLKNATSSMGNLWRRFRRKSVYSNDVDSEAVPVKTFKKKSNRYNALHLRQTLHHSSGRICVMAFNNPGSNEPLLLATAGEDAIINVWELNTNRQLRSFNGTITTTARTMPRKSNNSNANSSNNDTQDRAQNNNTKNLDNNDNGNDGKKNSTTHAKLNIEPHENEIPAFNAKPLRQFKGHTSYIISLSWNKGFLLSGSLDKTARLWHIKKPKSLVTFKHHGAVTAVAYHPFDIDVFVTGSFDSKLRMWSISKKRIILFKQTLGPISAVSYNPSGKMIAVGLLDGICLFYHHTVSHKTSTLQFHTQIECRNRRGKFRTGRKVSGFVWRKNGEELLISTNDSRVRLIRMRDYNPFMKFKGAIVTEAPITASFNESGTYVICGSEDGRVVVWTTDIDQNQIAISLKAYKNKNYSYESFQASSTVTTCAIFGPSRMARDVGCVGWEREHISTRYVKDIEDDCRFLLVGDLEGCLRIFEQRTKPKK